MITDKQFDDIMSMIRRDYPNVRLCASDVDNMEKYVRGLRKEIDDLELEVDASYGGKKHRKHFDDED